MVLEKIHPQKLQTLLPLFQQLIARNVVLPTPLPQLNARFVWHVLDVNE
jgi:hypothetical protein